MRQFFFGLVAVALVTGFIPGTVPQDPPPKKDGPAAGGERPVHDPSTVVKHKGEYWVFATGRGVASLRSKDLITWEPGPPVFVAPPKWVADVVPGNRGHFWAPDVIHHGGRYLLYYSVSTFGKNTSAIALVSNPTLDPADKEYKWTDHGVVVQTGPKDDHNAIDPCVVTGPDDTLWMAYGSFWSGIKLVQLDPKTGLRLAPDSPVHALANKEQIEAVTLYRHGDYFYHFVNWGWCCRGLKSTYNIRIGRSRTITGPYLDKDGVDLRKGGGSLVLETEERFIGPGHAGIFKDGDRHLLSYHFYDKDQNGRSKLAIRPLEWDKDGWPRVVGKPITPEAKDQWERQTIRTDADFRGLCAVNTNVAWVSGTKGTFGRTTDGGKTWAVGTVPDADKLDFRDVKAFSESTAYLLSIGSGAASRIYKTTDGGKTWMLQFQNADPDAFYDAMAFWDDKNGIALSDPVRGQFQLVATADGGATWKPLATKDMPATLPNEGAFAASGSCLVTHGEQDVWFSTGGAKSARIFHSGDRGRTWTVSETPVLAGSDSAGIFSIAFRDNKRGVIVGGDYRKPNDTGATAASTTDGGKTWTLIEKPFPFRSCVVWAKDRWIAVGTSGSDQSTDGVTWKALDRENYNCVDFTATGDGWAAGPKGRIAMFTR